jgi:hypothetical protein
VGTIVDEEIDEGGGETSLNSERSSEFGWVKIGNDLENSGYPVFVGP